MMKTCPVEGAHLSSRSLPLFMELERGRPAEDWSSVFLVTLEQDNETSPNVIVLQNMRACGGTEHRTQSLEQGS